jgi:primosomal protein N' (replication factor Y) (superfamily II helicase)
VTAAPGTSAAPPGTLVQVAVTLPLEETFTYRDPRSGARLPLGTEVIVPFGARQVTGFVVGHPESAAGPVRDISDVVGEGPAIDESILELCRWAAAYYLAPLGEVLRSALPRGERAIASRRIRLTEAGRRLVDLEADGRSHMAGLTLDANDRALLARLRAARTLSPTALARTAGASARMAHLLERGLVEIVDQVAGPTKSRSKAEARTGAVSSAQIPLLNPHQQAAFDALAAALGRGYGGYLLHGITGSGKTEVYLRLIAEARAQGKGALVLVPEIALTPQLAARFRARFGDDVAVLHSALPPAERLAAWRRLRSGEVGIAVGARSAVFAPVHALAVVVVDEEHDGSFKQEDGVRYHGRDMAVMRALQAKAVVVLGSATPSLESYRNVLLGRFRRLLLPTRANPAAAARPLPPVEIIDLRRHRLGPDHLLAPGLALAVADALAAGEQTILFLNRRGFSTLMHCQACGEVLRCSDCDVSMTLHRGRAKLICHYCGRASAIPPRCPSCNQDKLEGLGTGTERVESVVRELFPGARVARLDRDTTDGQRDQLEKLLARVHQREIDILVGTQMVTKGHDFGGVTLVGVLQPDQGMHLPDFRAAERTFQLLEQVAGRAGRGDRPGRIVVQTYCPEHPAIQFLRNHDYEGFVRDELARRESASYPPFSRMIAVRLDGRHEASVRAAATDAAMRARAQGGAAVQVLGPAEAPIGRLRGRSRYQIWLAGTDRGKLMAAARAAAQVTLPRDLRLALDVDPQSVL